jgi:KUP system potassium uptake protein
MRNRWGWSPLSAMAVIGIFLIVDFAFFAANLLKVRDGGWIPLAFGAMVFFIMTTWHAGIAGLHRRKAPESESPAHFFRRLRDGKVARVPGTAIFLARPGDEIPPLIVEHVKQIGALQKTVIALTVTFEQVPRVPPENRVEVARLADSFWHLNAHYGFVEIPNLPAALRGAKRLGCPIDLDNAIYFGERNRVSPLKRRRRLARWWVPIFRFMFRNSAHASDHFNLPPASYVEIGREVEL